MALIFNYSNYRDFLNDYFQEKKQASANFSLGVWARLLGVSNRSVLANILNGNRHPGRELQTKLISYFSFSDEEIKYFKDLVSLMKVQEKKHKIDIMMRNVEAKNHQIPKTNILDQTVYLGAEELGKIKNIMSTFQTKYSGDQKAYCLKIDLKA